MNLDYTKRGEVWVTMIPYMQSCIDGTKMEGCSRFVDGDVFFSHFVDLCAK